MVRDPRYDILFEPPKIGLVTAKNRFCQVPHCCGMGFNWPQTHAKLRRDGHEVTLATTAASVIMVTSRVPVNDLYQALEAAGIKSIRATGDCDASSIIALAVYDGHMAAREMDARRKIRICRFGERKSCSILLFRARPNFW